MFAKRFCVMLYLSTLVNSVASNLDDCKVCIKGKVEATGDKKEDDSTAIDWTDNSCKVAEDALKDSGDDGCKSDDKCNEVKFEDAAPDCKDYMKKLKKEECKVCVEVEVKENGEKKSDGNINWTDKSCGAAKSAVGGEGKCDKKCEGVALEEAAPDCKAYLEKLKKKCKDCFEGKVKAKGEKKDDGAIDWTYNSCKVAKDALNDGGDSGCKNDCHEAKMPYKKAVPQCLGKTPPPPTTTATTATTTSSTTTTTQETGASYAYKAEVSMFLAMMTLGVSIMAIL